MAYKPSLRAHNKVAEIPLDIRPVMNLMVVLIPILLYSAEFVKLAIRELNLPPSASTTQGEANQEQERKEKEKRFGLTVSVDRDGIYVANAAAFLTEGEEGQAGPTVPKLEDDSYDYQRLQERLIELKEAIEDKDFVDEKSVIISASRDIEYKHIIKVIDYVTLYEDEFGNQQELFPQINLGAVR